MSYIALYRKWRPLIFEDVVEQEHIIRTLKNTIISDRIAHAYLFSGTRGTGKTTTAKIFSRAINCKNPTNGNPCNQCETCKSILAGSNLDVLEIDAASNNSVDNVREIRDEIAYLPSQAKYKVYIIDEVHMLSTGAFNALLKTLEEPPKHVIFILATTEPHKLPVTILSRCQKFEFKRISLKSIAQRVEQIAKESNAEISEEASMLIAKLSDGALRDGISLLDQCICMSQDEISYKDVLEVAGIVSSTFISEIAEAIISYDVENLLKLVNDLMINGNDVSLILTDLIMYFRNLLIIKMSGKPENLIYEDDMEKLKRLSADIDRDRIMYIIKELAELEASLKWVLQPGILLEVGFIKICNNKLGNQADNTEYQNKILLLEKEIEYLKAAIEGADLKKSKRNVVEQQGTKQQESIKQPEKPKRQANKDLTDGKDIKFLENSNKILDELRKSGRMALYTNLMSTKFIEISDKIIGIVFQNDDCFGKLLVSKPENIEVVQDTIKRIFNREVRVKCVVDDELNSLDVKEDNNLIETAQKFAEGLNATFNVIDE